MSDQTIEDVHEEDERFKAATRILERQLDVVDPRGAPYRRELGIELPETRDYSEDELGTAKFRRDLSARRHAWLLSRWQEHAGRAERREQAARDRAEGIERFVPEGLSLDDLVAVALDTPAAFEELQRQRVERAEAGRETEGERVARLISRRERSRNEAA